MLLHAPGQPADGDVRVEAEAEEEVALEDSVVLGRALLHIEEIVGARPDLLNGLLGALAAACGEVAVLGEGDAVHHPRNGHRVHHIARRRALGQVGWQEAARVGLIQSGAHEAAGGEQPVGDTCLPVHL